MPAAAPAAAQALPRPPCSTFSQLVAEQGRRRGNKNLLVVDSRQYWRGVVGVVVSMMSIHTFSRKRFFGFDLKLQPVITACTGFLFGILRLGLGVSMLQA